ncbi:MAG: M14 family zinc carboxypeptidase [Bacteroidota bacterium]
MRTPFFVILCLALITQLFAQNTTPLEKGDYLKVTSYSELSAFVKQLDESSDVLKVETIGQSVQGRNLYALKFSSSEFGKDKSKIKVLFLAQQHGNEQSGKEGALLLARTLLKPENRYLLDRIDFAIVPQMNPDGSEVNERRNGHDMDLNRNHLILSEPETKALHLFFDKYLFEVTMDIHEYYPYGGDWEKYGYRRNVEETLGTTTNPNISENIRELSKTKVFPYWAKYLSLNNFSSFVYAPGGPPETDYIRQSTFDINDGRQSFGIQNTLSFIQEGKNGEDELSNNIRRRAEGQMTGMRGMLEYVYLNKAEIKKTLASDRKALASGKANPIVSIQSDHFSNGQKLTMPLFSYSTKKDTVVIVNDYRPLVKTLTDVQKPAGYLVPKNSKELLEWAGNHALTTTEFRKQKGQKIEQYFVKSIDSMDFERDIIINPMVEATEFKGEITTSDYIYIPTAQLKGNLIVLALEPKSELSLVTYKKYAHLLKVGDPFPVLRVEKK